MNLVNAQQARRVLDRLVGYEISPILWKKVKWGLSAGRVQSVAVKLICDRENEIKSFVPEEYWTITSKLKAKNKQFEAKFYGKNNEKMDLHNKEQVDAIIEFVQNKPLKYQVLKNKRKRKMHYHLLQQVHYNKKLLKN